jgi:AcrR family transcriptional regulator
MKENLISTQSMQIWVHAGYEEFALYGLEGIKVERLAKKLNRNKSGYYHYFVEHRFFLEALMDHHMAMAKKIQSKMKEIKNFENDFIQILLEFRINILAHSQLVANRNDDFFVEYYNRINEIVELEVIPKWSVYLGLGHNKKLASQLFEIFREMFYAQITPEHMNWKFLSEFIFHAKQIVEDISHLSKFTFQT